MKRQIYIIAATVITAALTLSCTEELDDNNKGQAGKQETITFTVDDSQDWLQAEGNEALTRAEKNGYFAPKSLKVTDDKDMTCDLTLTSTVVNGIQSEKMETALTRGDITTLTSNDFGVSGYYYDGTWDAQTPNLFYNIRGSYDSGSDKWTLEENQYWPNTTSNVRFFAYAPYTATPTLTTSPIILPEPTEVTKPYIKFTVNDDIDSQTDLLAAASFPTSYHVNTAVELPFKHALTCVKFAIGSGLPEGTLLSVALTNIVKRGTYYLDCNTPYWVTSDNPTDIKSKYELGGLSMNMGSAENTSILVDNSERKSTLLLIPQTLGADSKVELYYKALNGEYHTISASLEGTTWLPGTTVTYTLSAAANYTYVLEASSVTAGHQGGEATFYVTSYRQLPNGTGKTVVPWRVIGYSTDNGATWTTEKPAGYNWVGIASTSGQGGVNPEAGLAMFAAQTGSTPESLTADQDNTAQTNAMKANGLAYNSVTGLRGSNGNRYDLSTHDLSGKPTLRNTANCYVVNAPGCYKIPLAYGNAIKNGAPNEEAYDNTKTPGMDHQGNTILHPYIYDNEYSYQLDTAKVVWQDRENLVTPSSVKLDSNKEYLVFNISKENIGQGNVLLALYDKQGTVMWSWHIWVTAIDVQETIPVVNNRRMVYDMMTINLGWCSAGGTVSKYDGRSLMVKIQQENGKTATFNLSQTAKVTFNNSTLGWNPYYQFGRKDPMLPVDLEGNRITHYPNNTWDVVNGPVDYKTGIQNPQKMYICSGYWCSSRYGNAWNVGGGMSSYPAWGYRVKKTIYDPCPVGFHVPESFAFTGFTTTGAYSNKYSEFNVSGSFNKGWFFWTDETKTKTIFFPALGWWHSDGTMQNYATGGYYFPASLPSSSNYLWFYFENSYVQPLNDGSLPSFAESIRPIKE